jgi:NADH-quinone oxidoreductase subunit G
VSTPVPAKIPVKIDGRELSVPPGTLLVEAAKQAGIEIPVFCHHEKLKQVGACRMCVVEIERVPRLQTACTTPVAKDMVVHTDTKAVLEAREAVLEMLLVNHPLDCPICDKGGECPLQDNTFRHGAGLSRRTEPKRANAKALPLSDLIVLDRERCILCYRCTRFHDEIAGDGALVALERGGTSEIGVLPGTTYDSPFSGNTVELCPVGALTSRQYRFRARPWELETTPSVCCGCSVGCNVRVDARHGSVLRVMGRTHDAIDDGWLCDRGRYGSLPLPLGAEFASPDPASRRPRWPLRRIDGRLQRVSLDDALAHAAALLQRPKAAVALSASLTNEAMSCANRELRAAFATAAIGFAESVVSPWPVAGKIRDLDACRRILDLGCDPWRELPVLALWLRKAITAGG